MESGCTGAIHFDVVQIDDFLVDCARLHVGMMLPYRGRAAFHTCPKLPWMVEMKISNGPCEDHYVTQRITRPDPYLSHGNQLLGLGVTVGRLSAVVSRIAIRSRFTGLGVRSSSESCNAGVSPFSELVFWGMYFQRKMKSLLRLISGLHCEISPYPIAKGEEEYRVKRAILKKHN